MIFYHLWLLCGLASFVKSVVMGEFSKKSLKKTRDAIEAYKYRPGYDTIAFIASNRYLVISVMFVMDMVLGPIGIVLLLINPEKK